MAFTKLADRRSCRDYTTDECEYDIDSGYDKLFETPEQIEEYASTAAPDKRPVVVKLRQKNFTLPLVTG